MNSALVLIPYSESLHEQLLISTITALYENEGFTSREQLQRPGCWMSEEDSLVRWLTQCIRPVQLHPSWFLGGQETTKSKKYHNDIKCNGCGLWVRLDNHVLCGHHGRHFGVNVCPVSAFCHRSNTRGYCGRSFAAIHCYEQRQLTLKVYQRGVSCCQMYSTSKTAGAIPFHWS